MKRDEASTALANVAALWSTGYVRAAEVVRVACDALVAGLKGDGLSMLAGVAYRNADDEVPQVLKAALGELGLDYHVPGSLDAMAGCEGSRRTCRGGVDATQRPRVVGAPNHWSR